MIRSNKINIIVATAVVFALVISITLVAMGNMQAKSGGVKTEPEYAAKIFGAGIISIEIISNEDDWRQMLDNAISEQYIMADVIVNGKRFQNVGIRPKGNSSLSQVASYNSDRYSFRLQFDEYIKGQTCFGLESFVLNNMLGDNTYMKEYISYDLMREAGVDAPYFGFAGRGGWGSSGGSLEYIDDNTGSYSAIFDNVVGKGTEKDFQRVVQALKALSEGKELETYFDVDKILRYLAAHTIVVNLDSYSTNMAQNYYIYERDGQITILPWYYNLAWGGFQSGSASSVVNFPIDTPVSGVEISSRPLIDKLFVNTEYLERYHGYLQQLIDNYFANGKYEDKINWLDALICDFVRNDATAFCTYEEYKTAVSAFITLGNLRAQSVQGQLDGAIPSTAAGQAANPSLLIPAGDLNLSDLGSNMRGGRGGNMGFPGGVEGGQFEGMLQDGWQRTLPGIIGGAGQQNQNSNTLNRLVAGLPAGRGLSAYNLGVIVVLSFVLIAAIVFAARYKKSY